MHLPQRGCSGAGEQGNCVEWHSVKQITSTQDVRYVHINLPDLCYLAADRTQQIEGDI